MDSQNPSRALVAQSFARRFFAASVRGFHGYAAWLVSISWKRFALLSLLLVITAAILSDLPPFSWTIRETLEEVSSEHAEPRTPAPPKTPAAPRESASPKPPAEPRAPSTPAPAADVPDAKASSPSLPPFIHIENGKGPNDETVDISIGPNGVRIIKKPRAAQAAAEAQSAASAAQLAADAASAALDSLPHTLEQGLNNETAREAIKSAREELQRAIEDAKQEVEQARRDAEEARRDAEEAAADAAREAADAAREAADAAKTGTRTRISKIRLGDALPNIAMLWILGSIIIKATYKGRIQAEVKAAQATEVAESESLKRQVVEARMAAMQAQVEPHFLFNTLASIDHLIETDPGRASKMQKNLIALLRASMPTLREADTNLGRELAVIKPYLEILKVRMEERLVTEIAVSDGLLSADFPPMMLQSLVENAIKHGLEPKAEGGLLKVAAEIVHGKLVVTVADTGLGFGKADTHGTGVGLTNIRERLQLLYGGRAAMTITENQPSGTVVSVSLPYTSKLHSGADA